MNRVSLTSPVGPLTVWAENRSVIRLDWEDGPQVTTAPVLISAQAQLRAYFKGQRKEFDLPLSPRGNAFQQRFYAALCAIPYGQTRSYGDLAADLGVSPQAVGQACGANPIPIVIPCHRVLAANGLGGYSGAGGIEAKVKLLKLEGAASLLI